MIKLGDKVKDLATGFEGIVIAKTEYLNGAVTYLVVPKVDENGNLRQAEWIGSVFLEYVEEGIDIFNRVSK